MLKDNLLHLENLRIGDLLLRKGLVTQAVLEAAIATQRQRKQKLGEILVAEGYISPQQLKNVLREQRLVKVLASLLLTSGVGAVSIPQFVSPDSQLRPASVDQKKDGTMIGGGQLRSEGNRDQVSRAQQTKSLPDFMKVSLLSNPKPTVNKPLVGFCHPLDGRGWLSQGNNGITHRGRSAYAYDLASPIGTPIYAMRAGKVVGIQDKYPDTGGGRSNYSKFNYVWLEHDGGYRSAYLHLQQGFLASVPLTKGSYVEAGQLIGYSGNSGFSTGPHLHLEVQKPGAGSGFNQSIPFEVSGRCQSPSIAQRSPSNPS